MNDDFSWLDYDEPASSAADASGASSGAGRRSLRRFLPRLPKPRLPRLRRSRGTAESARPSASDILGGQADRPIEELDSRLRALRDRSAADQQPRLQGHQALYDVDEVLATPAFQQKPGGIISAVALSKAQQQQVEMLKDIVGGPPRSQDDGGGRPVFSLGAAPRLIASALLVLTVSLPFVSSDYAVGALPPAEFSEERPDVRTAYNLLDNLTPADYVLVAFEYGPTAAGELDALADLFLRHIFAQLAKPVIVSSNPIAIAHAQNIIAAINRSVADAGISLEDNRDYFLLRYLPGGALGLRELSENFDDLARVSAKGQLTGLAFSTLDEMSLLLLIAESAEDARLWAEQVLPETDGPRLIAATGYAAEPLARVYADSMDEIIGLIVGYRDTYTYGQQLDAAYGAPGGIAPLPEPPDEAPEAPAAPEPQAEQAAPTATPSATATMPSIPSPQPTFTPPPTATATPTDLPAPTATLEPLLYVEVTAPRLVNIRRGPTTADDVLAVASAGDRFEVLGTNGDGSWYNILLPDGLIAWIAAFLVEERRETPDQDRASASAPRERTLLRLDFTLRLGKNQPRFYQISAPSGAERAFVFARDRSAAPARLDAMTLGALGATLVIIMGNIVAAVSAFGRRRRAPQRS